MSKFQVGDKVKCVEATGYFSFDNIVNDKIYTVRDIVDDEMIQVVEIVHKYDAFHENKFILVEKFVETIDTNDVYVKIDPELSRMIKEMYALLKQIESEVV